MTHSGENSNLLEGLRKYWVLVVAIASFVMGWSQFNLRLEYQEARIERLEQSQLTTNTDLAELKNTLVELKAILNERLPAPKR